MDSNRGKGRRGKRNGSKGSDRNGGPDAASEDDNSQSLDESISLSSQGTDSQKSDLSKSESVGQASGGQVDEDDDDELEMNYDLDESEKDEESEPEKDDGWLQAALDVMKMIEDGEDVDEDEYEKVQKMLREPKREKQEPEVDKERFQVLDGYYQNDPEPIPHTLGFDKSIIEWSNLGYMLDDTLPEAAKAPSPFPSPSKLRQVWAPISVTNENHPSSASTSYMDQPLATPWPSFTADYSRPSTSAGPQPSTSAGPWPSTSAGAQSSTSTGPRPSTSAGPWPSTSASPQPSTSAGPWPSTSAGPQPSTSADPWPSTSAGPWPSTSAGPQPSTSADPWPSTSAGAQPSTSTGPQPSTSAGPHTSASSQLPPGIGLSYMYAAKATRLENRDAQQDNAIVSSIISNCLPPKPAAATGVSSKETPGSSIQNPQAVAEANNESTESPRKRFKGQSVPLDIEEEDLERTREEWDEIKSQVRQRPLNQKPLREALVDLETLLQVYQLSHNMMKHYTVAPKSILEAFQMAYRVKKSRRRLATYEPKLEELQALAKRLAIELLGAVPRYEDFPIPYMAGVDVPESWFFNRFRNISGFDRLRYYSAPPEHYWVTPTRYSERRKLRLLYVRPEVIARKYYYRWTNAPENEKVAVWCLLTSCSGPPFKPLPQRDMFHGMSTLVLRRYLDRFDCYMQEIYKTQQQERNQMQALFFDRFDVTMWNFRLFEDNYTAAGRYKGNAQLTRWNAYFRERMVEISRCLQRLIDVAQRAMLLGIKFADSWCIREKDIHYMLNHKIPIFDGLIIVQFG